jgi:hypothetical protein
MEGLHYVRSKTVYARISRFHQAILAGAYVAVLGAVIGVLFILGSRVRTHTLPSGSISLQIPYSKYLVGEAVSFTVKNNFNSAIYIANNCPAEPLAVYKLENQKWVRIHDTADIHECHTEDRQIRIPAGGSSSGSFAGWRNLFNTPGKYRLVVFVEYYNTLPYQDLEVIAKPAVPDIPAIVPKKPTVSTNTSPSRSTNQTTNTGSGGSLNSGATTDTSKQQTVSISAGKVTVSYNATTVTVLSVTPSSGYTYELNRTSGTQVQITFQGAGGETQLTLSVRNGQLVQSVERG